VNIDLFVCKGKRLANYLLERGSKLKRIDTDNKSKGFLVFLFEKDDLLQINLDTWDKDKISYLI
jgi:hypothetical protein